MEKKIFSGVQPTGNLHIGNYLGAIKNFVELNNDKNNTFTWINTTCYKCCSCFTNIIL